MGKRMLSRSAAIVALGDRAVVPGVRFGSLRLGMTYGEAMALLGAGACVVCKSLAFVRFPAIGIELALQTLPGQLITERSSVSAISVVGDLDCSGPVQIGARREDVDAKLGSPVLLGQRAVYTIGVSVHFDEQGCASAFTVVSPLAPSLFPRPHLRPWVASS